MKNLSKNMTLVAALTLAMTAVCGSAMAQDAVAAPAAAEAVPDNVVSYNVALTSDYRYRGVSQSRLNPAVSGGADYTHKPTGLYVGTWLSSIKWIKDGGGLMSFNSSSRLTAACPRSSSEQPAAAAPRSIFPPSRICAISRRGSGNVPPCGRLYTPKA